MNEDEGYAFDETDKDGVRLVVTDFMDGRPVLSIFSEDGQESDAFEVSISGVARLAELFGGALRATEEPFYTLEITLGGANGRTSGPDADGVSLMAERAIRALVEAQQPRPGSVLTVELARLRDELARYRQQDLASGKRIAELEAGVKLLEEQAAELANVRGTLRAAGRNPADPVASIRGLRVEAQGVDRRIAEATRALNDEIKTLRGQLGYQREQVDAVQKALREAVRESTEADAKLSKDVTRLRTTIEAQRLELKGRDARNMTLEGQLAEERRISAEQRDEIRTRTEYTLTLERQLHDTTELNNALVTERDTLRDALENMIGELCNADSGEPIETHFDRQSAELVVNAARRVIEGIYGD